MRELHRFSAPTLEQTTHIIADCAVNALLDEVHTTPKPGLVDSNNSGAHLDMDIGIFEHSAYALRPFFTQCVWVGMTHDDCMPTLQQIGLNAEEAMYQATGGVNTHKGSIYALGLLLAATGASYLRGTDIFLHAAQLAKQASKSNLPTNGMIAAKKYRVGGARAEAEQGFPTVKWAYTLLKKNHGDGVSTLLHIMMRLDDTNLLHRGGLEGLQFAQNAATYILSQPESMREHLVKELDAAFIKRNLSPGGCADILAAAYYLKYSESFWNNTSI